MGRRVSLLLLVAVVAAFGLGWQNGLFMDEARSTLASRQRDAPSQARPGSGASAVPGTPADPDADTSSIRGAPAAPDPQAPATPGTSAGPAGSDAAWDKPSFDIVRVEPDGSAVIAGRGRPNATIALTNGSAKLGETRTDANGDFVFDLSLPAGEHRLRLADAGESGDATATSEDSALVSVPPRDRPGELLVMMERPGEASEILVRPQPAERQVAALAPASPADAAPSLATTQGASDPATGAAPADVVPGAGSPGAASPAAETAGDGETGNVAAVTAEPRMSAGTAGGDVTVEAVEIENGKLFIAGAADSRSTIRIYLDDKLVAETRGGAGDRFIASARADVAVGDHRIRADVIGPDGQVAARAEVPFNRPDMGPMAAVASARAPVAVGAVPGAGETAAGSGPPTGVASAPGGTPAGAPAGETPDLAGRIDAPSDASIAAASSLQAPLETVQARVIIRRGDSLWRISRATYGRGSRYSVIYLANGDQIRNPDRIYPGQVFRLPKDEPPPGNAG